MKKPNLRDLELEDPQLPESPFMQVLISGIELGAKIVGTPVFVGLIWLIGQSRINGTAEVDAPSAPGLEGLVQALGEEAEQP